MIRDYCFGHESGSIVRQVFDVFLRRLFSPAFRVVVRSFLDAIALENKCLPYGSAKASCSFGDGVNGLTKTQNSILLLHTHDWMIESTSVVNF